jgi:small subunit ribosomal protein S9
MSERKVVISKGSRKTAAARCYLTEGKGRVYFNGIPLELYPIEMVRLKIMEPLILAKDVWIRIDARIEAFGGGIMGQAEAARMALARAMVKFAESKEVEKIFKDYDRTMLVGDHRRTESEKWMRYGARRWRQKSYR